MDCGKGLRFSTGGDNADWGVFPDLFESARNITIQTINMTSTMREVPTGERVSWARESEQEQNSEQETGEKRRFAAAKQVGRAGR